MIWFFKRIWARLFYHDRVVKLNFNVKHKHGEVYQTPLGGFVLYMGRNWYYILNDEDEV